MSAAKKIQDQIAGDGFGFGLWSECPENVPVAWGARAIADHGCGFSLLPDRQSMAGSEVLRNAFSRVLNGGPLARAIDECKRLRDGWYPCEKLLSVSQFENYWYRRKREEPELFASWSTIGDSDGVPKIYGVPEDPRDTNTRWLYEALVREVRTLDAYRLECKQDEDEEEATPDPPSSCEDPDDEACNQDFKKVHGRWDGCYEEDGAWICESCGGYHDFEDLADAGPPLTPVIDAYSRVIGYQRPKMESDKAETFTLFSDSFVTIKANTNASFGYVYLIAYPKHRSVDAGAVMPSDSHPGFNGDGGSGGTRAKGTDVFWSGAMPIPMPGDRVEITRPQVGPATVLSHFVGHNYLHLITVPDGRLPDFWYEQRGDRYFPPSETWNVVGCEISDEIEIQEGAP